MKVRWTRDGFADLQRIGGLLESRSSAVAARTIDQLVRAPSRLSEHPRIGMRLEAFLPREVRRLIVGDYEVRYEIAYDVVNILRIHHALEDR
jgi:plasmid stabilization system protein ParE